MFAVYTFSLVKWLLTLLGLFAFFFFLNCKGSLYILDTSPLSVMGLVNIFSHLWIVSSIFLNSTNNFVGFFEAFEAQIILF